MSTNQDIIITTVTNAVVDDNSDDNSDINIINIELSMIAKHISIPLDDVKKIYTYCKKDIGQTWLLAGSKYEVGSDYYQLGLMFGWS